MQVDVCVAIMLTFFFKIRIPDVQKSDEGLYSCGITVGNLSLETKPMFVPFCSKFFTYLLLSGL